MTERCHLCDETGYWTGHTRPRGDPEPTVKYTGPLVSTKRAELILESHRDDPDQRPTLTTAIDGTCICILCNALHDLLAARRELDEARVLAAVLGKWLHRECVMSGFDLDGGSVQEKLLSLGFAEMHLPEPGSPEEEEYGQD